MIGVILALLGAALGGAAVVTFWNSVREAVTGWLQRNNLTKSALTEAVIVLDKLAVGIRRRIIVQTAQRREVVREEELSLDQIDDPQVRAEIQKRSHVQLDIMHQI